MKRKESAEVVGMLDELKRAASAIGLTVREEEILRGVGYRARSGVCRVGERTVVVIDRRLPGRDRIEILCRALADQDADALERVFLSPALREKLAAMRPPLPSDSVADPSPAPSAPGPPESAPAASVDSGG